jgi:hypothetical protein
MVGIPVMDSNTEKCFFRPASRPWHPAVFSGLAIAALVFWPISALGLWSLISRVEARRYQGIVVILASAFGFFWGWKLIWGLFAGLGG